MKHLILIFGVALVASAQSVTIHPSPDPRLSISAYQADPVFEGTLSADAQRLRFALVIVTNNTSKPIFELGVEFDSVATDGSANQPYTIECDSSLGHSHTPIIAPNSRSLIGPGMCMPYEIAASWTRSGHTFSGGAFPRIESAAALHISLRAANANVAPPPGKTYYNLADFTCPQGNCVNDALIQPKNDASIRTDGYGVCVGHPNPENLSDVWGMVSALNCNEQADLTSQVSINGYHTYLSEFGNLIYAQVLYGQGASFLAIGGDWVLSWEMYTDADCYTFGVSQHIPPPEPC